VTGPQHYREAERLLNMLPSHGLHPETGMTRDETFAAAQVHATLADTAARVDAAIATQWGIATQEKGPQWGTVTS
jgi:hypothetical protein